MQRNSSQKYIVDGFELTYSSEWIKCIESLQHWRYYWNQASLVWEYVNKNEKVFEVGIGSGFLKNYLTAQGWNCISLDIDAEKEPDIIGDVSSIDLSDFNFDCALAFEIFEHLPFPLFRRALHNIAQHNPPFIIFSLPWSLRRVFELNLKLPKIKGKTLSFQISKNKINTPNHFWELKKSGKDNEGVITHGNKGFVSLKNINELFSSIGYDLTLKQKVDNIQFFVAAKI